MDERQAAPGTPGRRVLRAVPTPVDVPMPDQLVESSPPLLDVVDDLAEPRVADLNALLRDVDGLRATLRQDLSLAATAAAAGESELAAWLLVDEDAQLHRFEERTLARLGALQAEEGRAATPAVPAQVRRSRRTLSAAPFAAAAAVVFAFVAGVVPTPGGSGPGRPATSSVAMDSYAELTQLAADGASDRDITAAAERFHADLAPLVAAALTDPTAAKNAISLLQSERAVLAAAASSSSAVRAVLREADRLVARLRASLARVAVPRPVVPPVQSEGERKQPERRESSRPSSAKPSASPSPTPTRSASPSPSPSQKPPPPDPEPTPSPSDEGPLPKAPTAPV